MTAGGRPGGKIWAVSLGQCPGQITPEAAAVLGSVDVVAGHHCFIHMARHCLRPDCLVIDDRVTRGAARTFEQAQRHRVASVTAQALLGRQVAVLSSGDTGIWGEAGFFLEAAEAHPGLGWQAVPGVPGLCAAAARVGAPLMNGFALISLGDEDTPWERVRRRLEGAAYADIAIVLYKVILESSLGPEYYPPDRYPELTPPRQRTSERWAETYAILARHRAPSTPVAVVTDACSQTSFYQEAIPLLGAEGGREEVSLADLGSLPWLVEGFRFLTTVIVGDSTTRVAAGRLITPQWNYHWRYSPEVLQGLEGLDYLVPLGRFLGEAGR